MVYPAAPFINYDLTTGELLTVCWSDPGPFGPTTGGYYSFSMASLGTTDFGELRWNKATRALESNNDRIQENLIYRIKQEVEAAKMAALTPGGAKKTEYAEKRGEVLAWYALGAVGASGATLLTAFNLLPADVKALRFPFAMADAQEFGDTVPDAIARFRAGMTPSTLLHAKMAGKEAKAIAMVKAAATAAAKRTAAAVSWTS